MSARGRGGRRPLDLYAGRQVAVDEDPLHILVQRLIGKQRPVLRFDKMAAAVCEIDAPDRRSGRANDQATAFEAIEQAVLGLQLRLKLVIKTALARGSPEVGI